ncbi:MAG: hypothetical protein JWQ08_824 [Deinococcus sp.]|nr:hypothetical protein [Deinococcus sp.]
MTVSREGVGVLKGLFITEVNTVPRHRAAEHIPGTPIPLQSGDELRPSVIPRDKRQRTFKLSGSTETQLAHLCHATGSGATAIVEQALAHYYRDLFGQQALLSFSTPQQAPHEHLEDGGPPRG